MTPSLAGADPIRLSSRHGTQDLRAAMELNRRPAMQMAIPSMPSHSSSCRADSPRRTQQGMLLEPRHGLSTVRGPSHDIGSINLNADEQQLFEHALTAMRRDQHIYALEEGRSGSLKHSIKPRTNGPGQNVQPTRKRQSRGRNAQATKAVRPPALAATHPSLYQTCSTLTHCPRRMLPTPPPEVQDEDKVLLPVNFMPLSTPVKTTVAPWKKYTDPKRLVSVEPRFDDPKYKMLKMDVNPEQPNVISPLFMIGMPCGSLIEAANYYNDEGHISDALDG